MKKLGYLLVLLFLPFCWLTWVFFLLLAAPFLFVRVFIDAMRESFFEIPSLLFGSWRELKKIISYAVKGLEGGV